MAEKEDSESDRSVVRECYWILCGQFSDSDETEDKVKSTFIAIAVATGVLTIAAATSSLLVSTQNWPVAVLGFLVGIGVIVFAWYVGLHRLDWILIDSN